jgi:AcrR family transcriptional regulator
MTAVTCTAKFHRRGDCRAEEILQATLDVLCEKGFRATRLDDVAARAGVTKPLIYHYFHDKNDLIHRTMEWRLNQVLSEKREEMQGLDADWETNLRNYARWQRERWSRPEVRGFHEMVGSEMRQEDPDLYQKWVEAAYGEKSRFVQEILHKAVLHLRGDVDLAAASRSLVLGLWSILQNPSEGRSQESLIETTLDIFIAGIRRGPEAR